MTFLLIWVKCSYLLITPRDPTFRVSPPNQTKSKEATNLLSICINLHFLNVLCKWNLVQHIVSSACFFNISLLT
jgi:hypothetical protein